jgi:hypothetical protein
MQKGDVITIMTPIGEYVGRFENLSKGELYVTDPKLIVNSPDNKVGFGRGVCMSAVENIEEVTFCNYLFVAPTNEVFEKAWREATSGLIV